jgi:uncharacterized protein YcsI (UPF0317 family)
MSESGLAFRRLVREGYRGSSLGRARSHLQANLFVLPAEAAREFVRFCEENPAALPLLAVGRRGDPRLPELGDDLDVRTDLPGYLLHRNGVATPAEHLMAAWRKDLVAIATGSWCGAEAALARAGISMRHAERGLQPPVFRSWIPAVPAGRFAANLAVAMRPFAPEDVRRVSFITGRLPRSHGGPVHRGHPAHLGILDPATPDWGEALAPEGGEECLFWASEQTGLVALEKAGLPFYATHAPGCLLVTDLVEDGAAG